MKRVPVVPGILTPHPIFDFSLFALVDKRGGWEKVDVLEPNDLGEEGGDTLDLDPALGGAPKPRPTGVLAVRDAEKVDLGVVERGVRLLAHRFPSPLVLCGVRSLGTPPELPGVRWVAKVREMDAVGEAIGCFARRGLVLPRDVAEMILDLCGYDFLALRDAAEALAAHRPPGSGRVKVSFDDISPYLSTGAVEPGVFRWAELVAERDPRALAMTPAVLSTREWGRVLGVLGKVLGMVAQAAVVPPGGREAFLKEAKRLGVGGLAKKALAQSRRWSPGELAQLLTGALEIEGRGKTESGYDPVFSTVVLLSRFLLPGEAPTP